MIGSRTTTETRFDRIRKAADKSVFRNIRHAAFSIRKYIRQSIKRQRNSSAVGDPVATRGKRSNVKNSIFVAADKETALIGPRHSFVGKSMELHEFGKARGGQRFKERPTSGPALTANTDRFANSFAGSIGE